MSNRRPSAVAVAVIFLLGISLATAEERPSGGVTFSKDIAPIFQQRCQSCHRPGQIGPMSLLTFDESRPWAKAIRKEVQERRMPPFHAAGPIGFFLDDPRMSEKEIATIAAWVDGGAPEGNPADTPPARQWNAEWQLGTPDLILRLPKPHTVEPGKKDEYEFFVFDHAFADDLWLRGMEVRPGRPQSVHHAVVCFVNPVAKTLPDGRVEGDFNPFFNPMMGEAIYGWSPGALPLKLAEGLGRVVPRGSRLGISMHYIPETSASTDQTEVGLYLANGRIDQKIRSLIISPEGPTRPIAPGQTDFRFQGSMEFPMDARIISVNGHMHLRGKSFVLRLQPPGGEPRTALEIPRYDFNWQRTYSLAHPIDVARGTKAECIGIWDNSAANPTNPDPTVEVVWGFYSNNEMLIGDCKYVAANEHLGLNVRDGRAERRVRPGIVFSIACAGMAGATLLVVLMRRRSTSAIAKSH